MKLSIPEKFLLLAKHPEKGRFIISGIHMQYGLVGSVLLEMSVEDRFEIRNNLLYLKATKLKGNSIVSEVETMIRASSKPSKIRYWVNKLSRKSNKYKRELLASMSHNRLIRIENKKFLGIIPYKLTYLVNQRLRKDLIGDLRRSLRSKQEVEEEHAVLLGLIEAAKMYKLFSTDAAEMRVIKKQLKEIVKDSPIAGTVDSTIKGVQAAIFTTIIASSVVTSSSH